MPLAESRAQVNLVEDAIVEAGDYEKFLNSKDERIKGELSKNGSETIKNSTLDEIKLEMKELANEINAGKDKLQKSLTGLTPEKLMNQMFGGNPAILNPVSEVYGVFKSVLCWDGNLDLSLRDLIDALDFDFNFMLTWSICNRQGIVNPINNLLNSINRLEQDINDLANIGPRLLNNLRTGVKGFIKKSGLPEQLQRCMLQSSFLNNASKYNNHVSLSAAKDLLTALDASICNKSSKPLPSQVSKTVEKVAMSPFVEGLRDYDRDLAIGSIVSLTSNPQIDTQVLQASLIESFRDEEVNNSILFLEMIAITKGFGVYDKRRKDSLAIGDITSLLVYNSETIHTDASSSLVDVALANIEDASKNKTQELKKALNGVDDEYVYIPKLDAEVLFKNMKDDYSNSTTPKEDLDRIKKLLPVCIDGFKPSENVKAISHSDTIMTLQGMNNQLHAGVRAITNKDEVIGSSTLKCLELQANNDPYFQSFLISEARKQAEA